MYFGPVRKVKKEYTDGSIFIGGYVNKLNSIGRFAFLFCLFTALSGSLFAKECDTYNPWQHEKLPKQLRDITTNWHVFPDKKIEQVDRDIYYRRYVNRADALYYNIVLYRTVEKHPGAKNSCTWGHELIHFANRYGTAKFTILELKEVRSRKKLGAAESWKWHDLKGQAYNRERNLLEDIQNDYRDSHP